MLRFALVIAIFAWAMPAEAARSAKAGVGPSTAPAAGSARIGGSSARMLHDPRVAPPLDPLRKVNEQDCTKPVDLQGGNLKCR